MFGQKRYFCGENIITDMRKLLGIVITAVLLLAAVPAGAQKVALKTNMLYWATGTINLSVETALAPKVTLDITGTGNPFVFGDRELNRKLWHWTVQPEARFWHWAAFNGGFIGVHATTGSYSAGGIEIPLGIFPEFKNYRYEGWMAGLGVSYGWQWYLGPHWNLEATFGFGYLYLEYNKFTCARCGDLQEANVVRHYFGPTKIGVSFSYLFRSKK